MFSSALVCRPAIRGARALATVAAAGSEAKSKVKFLIVGGGTAGLSVAHQLYYKFAAAKQRPADGDITVVDPAEYHYYQPGWTLVGAGLKRKETTRDRLSSLIPKWLSLRSDSVAHFDPASNSVALASGQTLSYDVLIVAAGLQINWGAIKGLPEALADDKSGVSSIYSYNTCDRLWRDINALKSGPAVFTQPAGVIKCAGAPQKVMWCAWDRFRRTGRGSSVNVEFWTGAPSMFAVAKYSGALEELRVKRGVRGEFQRNLVAVDPATRSATFAAPDGKTVQTPYALLHVVPPQGPLDVLRASPLADAAGWIDVDPATLRHKKPEFGNVFAVGDCSSLPTSKTAAAITAQAPVLVDNVFSLVTEGRTGAARYDGYTSCPLLTGYNELMLAEFKYGLEPKETFGSMIGLDQKVPRRVFYHLKKDIFPRAYWNLMIKGMWYGPKAVFAPRF